jgi:hypothetical protein
LRPALNGQHPKTALKLSKRKNAAPFPEPKSASETIAMRDI